MSEAETTHGLACPNCGGMVPVPEGQVIVKCPFCNQRSFVRGEHGLQRFQVGLKIERPQAESALRKFLSGHQAIARDAARAAKLEEAFVAYLPFWTSWSRIMGWVFGQKRVGSGDDARYEPREVQVIQEASWNGAACDVGEFGVEEVPLGSQTLEIFDPETLHQKGMVFEPVSSSSQAQEQASQNFNERVRRSVNLDRIAQVFVRLVRQRAGLVYYPLWVIRYLYRGRAFQVAVDGNSGEVLYGKAPGNSIYRATILVGGMALGALLAIDAPAFLFSAAANSSGDSDGGFIFGLVLIAVGFGLMFAAYRTFRYGEQYEYRKLGKKKPQDIFQAQQVLSQIQGVEKWVDLLS